MRFRRTLLPALSVFVALSLPGIAGAQLERESKTSSGDHYEFKDDPLNALTEGAMGAQIRVMVKPYRVQLIRPRTHFIPEMYKSVEHL